MSATVLLDRVREALGLRTDRELAERLNMTAPEVSILRSGRRRLGPLTLIAIQEETGWAMDYIKGLGGLPRGLPCLRK